MIGLNSFQVKLIVVENVTKPFRDEGLTKHQRRRVLMSFTQRFQRIASQHDIAVLFTNEMTESDTAQTPVPYLGKKNPSNILVLNTSS